MSDKVREALEKIELVLKASKMGDTDDQKSDSLVEIAKLVRLAALPDPREQEPVAYPPDITERWFEMYDHQKFFAREAGKRPPLNGLTLVCLILLPPPLSRETENEPVGRT